VKATGEAGSGLPPMLGRPPINFSLRLTLYCPIPGGEPSGAVMTYTRGSKTFNLFRRLACFGLAAGLGLAAAGCTTTQPTETSSLGIAAAGGQADQPRSAQAWGERYRVNPSDPETAVHYARALRASGLRAQAVAVLERAAIAHPKHRGVLAAYGRALADAGHYKQALAVLDRVHKSGEPDWRILSVQGAALDQMGRHEEAQRYYGTALRIAPNEPSVLSNLGLSYALSKDLVRAEATLRQATAQSRVDPRVRQNLALVVGLQGRYSEAESIARADLPSEAAAANVAYLRQMLAQQNGWKQSEQSVKPTIKAEGG
jgi:Flp pilus assembly protein TadD